ncbi:DUF4865 family protein [Jeongeupia chitinilytica]|uniref:DUF4865 domain-containing protein n=1 Tax=Jeongeupia chitinilytica TaxID=1041641 RepID=A0ABQ3H5H8_9NEIS|nr:DUF4865 family protein [Jeongeupia chitinilytica]GHD68378.1 DUF4865 domain-containing protein [Jeongeupia chitinilytica]
MIAMQYSILLPADYDMAIIDARIATRGGLTDRLSGLVFKAYLSARHSEGARHNLYAPFYLWQDIVAMNAFLSGPGFAGLCADFGRPSVQCRPVWQAGWTGDLPGARFASRTQMAMPSAGGLGDLRAAEAGMSCQRISEHGACAALVAYDPTSWTLTRFALWIDRPVPEEAGDVQPYAVGHVSAPDLMPTAAGYCALAR